MSSCVTIADDNDAATRILRRSKESRWQETSSPLARAHIGVRAISFASAIRFFGIPSSGVTEVAFHAAFYPQAGHHGLPFFF